MAADGRDIAGSAEIGGKRLRIIEIARRLFSKGTYLGVSMSDIAKQVGVAKAALYHYFDSKSAIYSIVLESVFAELRLRVERAADAERAGDALHGLIESYLTFGLEERNFINALVVKLGPDEAALRNRVAGLMNDLVDEVQAVIERALAKPGLEQTLNPELAAEMLIGMMNGLLIDYSFFDRKVDSSAVASQIIDLLHLDSGPASYGGTQLGTA